MGLRRHLALVLVVVMLLALGATAAAASTPTATSWIRPVGGRVVIPFDPPRTRYGAGHLGADLAAPPGTEVHAAAPGVVAFAGSVAGSLHVVIAHAGGLRTSYSFLETIAVRRGDRIAAGAALGTSGGTGQGHDGSVLHLGLRVGDTYVDPMRLFDPVDLATIVHLAPTTVGPRPASGPSERRGLLAGLAHAVGSVAHVTGSALDAAGHAVGTAVDATGGALVAAGKGAGRLVARRFPIPAAVVRGTLEWVARRGHCDPHAPPADGTGGSGHRIMIVAGIESSRSPGHRALDLPAASLGYHADEVAYFYYSAHGPDYTPKDTEQPLMVAAKRLGEQLRALQRREPGREVDLLGHSQGGVVVEAFLARVYKPGDRAYPPLGTVVTLSAPLRGAPLASALADIRRTITGRRATQAVSGIASKAGVHLPDPDAQSVADLAATSDLMRELDASRLPDQVDLTTIGSATDVVVPGNASSRPGARSTVVLPSSINAHSGIVTNPAALRAVRAALEDRPLPCRSLITSVAGEVVPTVITSVEHDAGSVAGAAGAIADVAS
jgi:hypothetical protein